MEISKAKATEVLKAVKELLEDNQMDYTYVNIPNLLYEGVDYVIPSGYVSVLIIPMGNEDLWKVQIGLIQEDKEFQGEVDVLVNGNLDTAIKVQNLLLKHYIKGV